MGAESFDASGRGRGGALNQPCLCVRLDPCVSGAISISSLPGSADTTFQYSPRSGWRASEARVIMTSWKQCAGFALSGILIRSTALIMALPDAGPVVGNRAALLNKPDLGNAGLG